MLMDRKAYLFDVPHESWGCFQLVIHARSYCAALAIFNRAHARFTR